MVIVQVNGGLGNQISCYAAGRSIAHKLNAELKIDYAGRSIQYKQGFHDHYRLGEFNIQSQLATPEEISRVKEKGKRRTLLTGSENSQDDIYVPMIWVPYDEKYFKDVVDILCQEFTLKNPLTSKAEAWKQKILSAECSVSLHVRRGDFLIPMHVHIYGILPLDYYGTCVERLKKSFSNLTIFVFSDDLKWARENLKLDVPMEFVEGCATDDEDFALMRLCKHNILANSTFSWWVGYLNPNPDKKIFIPDHRGRNYTHELAIPKNWIKIPVDYEKGVPDNVPPFLSIIFYVENAESEVDLSHSGILDQTYRNYEIILVDNTAGKLSENFYQQFNAVRKVIIIKENQKIDRAKAYNLALQRSRGVYVLFLHEKDIILRQMNSRLCYQIERFRLSTDIYCYTSRLYECDDGDKIVNDIKDKKFSIHCDESWENLRLVTLYNRERLQNLKTSDVIQTFNLLLETKVFRRDFLEKNALHFNENSDENFEVSFFIDALKCSENVVLVPEAFYIAPRK